MACGSCTGGTDGGCGCSAGIGCGGSCPTVSVHDWMPDVSPSMPDLVEVAFKHRRRRIFRNDRKLRLASGDDVIVGVRGGIDFGHVTMKGELVQLRAKPRLNYNRVIRIATRWDRKHQEKNRESEVEALSLFRAAANRRALTIKAVDAEWQHDRKRISFFYTATKSINVRSLIPELGRRLEARVDLKRINKREEAARIGGIGVCGRELCCSSWMHSMPQVSLSAAKAQQFPLSVDRLRGRCNRLKCCLNYELDHYMEALKDFPERGAIIRTERGDGRVDQVDIFFRTVTLKYHKGPPETVSVEDITPSAARPKGRSAAAPRRQATGKHP